MKPQHLAQILLRVIAIFLVWRAIEFGISQYAALRFQMSIYPEAPHGEMKDIFNSAHIFILLSAVIPTILAVILWGSAPLLAGYVVPGDFSEPASSQPLISADILMQAAAYIFIAMAFSTLPPIIYSFTTERLKDPTVTVMTSRGFLDSLQFVGKVVVGGIILLIVKKRTGKSV